ncbi:MAG TPA: aldo/keto reductase [Planctomycetota bacterium]|nr:aldo/keto reductase [Planctomycetota bacterium]
MKLIDFGRRSGLRVARASIGGMRLPEDHDQAVAVIRRAIDAGMRYIDTSRGYGESEVKFGKALKGGYREKVILSSKWSPWIQKVEPDDAPTADCMLKRIEDSLRRLDVDCIDFYQVWNVHSPELFEAATRPGGTLDGIRRAMSEGLVRHTGMTAHDKPANLLAYLPSCDWCEVLLLSYNLLDTSCAPVLAEAHRLGMGTIVMNPLAGGRLAGTSPELENLARECGAKSVPDLALRWLLSNPDIDTYISGINKPSDVDGAVAAAEAGPLAPEAYARVNAFAAAKSRTAVGYCTGCGYCKPCTQGIDIPEVMTRIYEDRVWGLKDAAAARYRRMGKPRADACTDCGNCEAKCTRSLKISDEMKYAAGNYELKK